MEETLYSVPIPSEGAKHALMRARQFTDLTWTPLVGTVPTVTKKDGQRVYVYYPAGEEARGIPYSSVYEVNTYVGGNVSLETFVSATCNPRSYLYTRDLREECTEPKAATYYGTVCSKFVQWALGIDECYNTGHFDKIDGMKKVLCAGEYAAEDLALCDVLLCKTRHTAIVTDILRDKSGKIRRIEVSEETTAPAMRRQAWEAEEYFQKFGKYDVYRYGHLDAVEYKHSPVVNVYDETYALDDRKYDILTRRGDKCNFPAGEAITLDVLSAGWKTYTVLRDGAPFAEGDAAAQIPLGRLPAGYYTARLADGERTSRPCFFCVTECSATAQSTGDGEVRVSYRHSAGEPVWIQVGSIGESYFTKCGGSGDETVRYDPAETPTRIARVGFRNEYGIYVSSFAEF